MLYRCKSLKKINLSTFNTNNVTNMPDIFCECTSLKELDISNFNINKETNTTGIFSGCFDELKMKIKAQFKNIKEESFQ